MSCENCKNYEPKGVPSKYAFVKTNISDSEYPFVVVRGLEFKNAAGMVEHTVWDTAGPLVIAKFKEPFDAQAFMEYMNERIK